MITPTKIAIGQLKSSITVYCTICGCSHRRSLKANIYQNTPKEIEKAKAEIYTKAAKEYTCRICKSIKVNLSNY